jgi:hypothetical protein
MTAGMVAVRRTLVALAALYAAFLVTAAAARRHAAVERAEIAAARQVEEYRAVVSGARTVTPTELARLADHWLRDPAPPQSPLDSARPAAIAAWREAGQAIIDRAHVILGSPESLDPDERATLTDVVDSISAVLRGTS